MALQKYPFVSKKKHKFSGAGKHDIDDVGQQYIGHEAMS